MKNVRRWFLRRPYGWRDVFSVQFQKFLIPIKSPLTQQTSRKYLSFFDDFQK